MLLISIRLLLSFASACYLLFLLSSCPPHQLYHLPLPRALSRACTQSLMTTGWISVFVTLCLVSFASLLFLFRLGSLFFFVLTSVVEQSILLGLKPVLTHIASTPQNQVLLGGLDTRLTVQKHATICTYSSVWRERERERGNCILWKLQLS